MIGFGPLLLVDSGLSLIDGPSPKSMLASLLANCEFGIASSWNPEKREHEN